MTKIWLILLVSSCSLEAEGLRAIRAHTVSLMGIAHAPPMAKAERLCQNCHGLNLVGGDNGEPSCYQCHGRKWTERDPAVSLAPDDHTVDNNGFMHNPDLLTPMSTCISCHGANLEGSTSEETPSCYLCHQQLW